MKFVIAPTHQIVVRDSTGQTKLILSGDAWLRNNNSNVIYYDGHILSPANELRRCFRVQEKLVIEIVEEDGTVNFGTPEEWVEWKEKATCPTENTSSSKPGQSTDEVESQPGNTRDRINHRLVSE